MSFIMHHVNNKKIQIQKRNMPIIKYDPFKELDRFFDEDLFGFLPSVRKHIGPPMDVYETDRDLMVELQAPNLDPSKVNISVEDGILKIEAGSREEKKEEGKNYYRKEIRSDSFVRMLNLPVEIKEDETKANYENGVLKITLPKTETKKPKRVEIKVS